MRCLSGTSKSTAGASAPALRMSGERAQELGSACRPAPAAKGWPGDSFCTCVLLNSEAGGPKKGKSGCVAAGRGGLGEAGSALTFSNCVRMCESLGGGAGGEDRRGWESKDLGECWLRMSLWVSKSYQSGCLHSWHFVALAVGHQ